MHNIVILGGNFAGVSSAHYLLRNVLPSIQSSNSQYKVILISPSDHTFFYVGAPRALVSEKVPIGKPFALIPDAFKKYDSSEFDFIQGEAIEVDESTKTVSIKSVRKSEDTSVPYEVLIVATGAKSTSPIWRLQGSHDDSLSALKATRARIPSAKTILIAGGGPVGVETAGEIASFYPDKGITLLSGTTRLLPRLQNHKIGSKAEQKLAALKVKTVHNVRVTSSQSGKRDKTSLTLSDGTTKLVDLYIDATGATPNTSFLPPTWLDPNTRRVVTDPHTLRATQAPAGIYAIGDAASYSKGAVVDAMWAVPALGYSVWFDLNAVAEKVGQVNGKKVVKEKKYEQFTKDMQMVPVGPGGGVGVMFGWSIPSWLVWLIKSRTFMLEKAAGLAAGADV